MRMQSLFGMLLVLSSLSLANEFGDRPEVKAITKDQPKEVVAFIERLVECQHWADEEAYDKARADEIRKSVDRAGCDHLNADEHTIKAKYKSNKKVSQAIERSKRLNK